MPALGSTVVRYERLTSTNDKARELAASGASEGTAIIADEQSAGRGRQGRTWSSPAGDGLYLSIVLRPDVTPADATVLTLAAAVAVAETLAIDFGITTDIKWPNDVLASHRKICGILLESAIEGAELQFVVLGIGLNLNQHGFEGGLAEVATSMLLESGQRVAVDDVTGPLFQRLERWYRAALAQTDKVFSRWEQLSSYARGRAVRIDGPNGVVEGVTDGLAPSGALKLRLASGETREIVAGEVSLRKE